MAMLRMDPSELRIAAERMRSLCCNLEETMYAVRNMIEYLQTGWESEETMAFAKKAETLMPACMEMAKILEEYAEDSISTAAAMEETECSVAYEIKDAFGLF